MAPGTNLGAATPIADRRRLSRQPDASRTTSDGSRATRTGEGDAAESKAGMEDKAVNDAIAYIRSLAQMRGRNVEWAEKAVREAASLSAAEALERAGHRPGRAPISTR